MTGAAGLTRRAALKAGGALVLAFNLGGLGSAEAAPKGARARMLRSNPALDSWLRVNADGTVTLFTGRVELGQGVGTALAQIAADELDLDFASVSVVTADTDRTPDEGYTFGSMSVEVGGTAVRLAAAEVRHLLLEMAARRLDAPANTLAVQNGVVTTSEGGKSVGYGDLFGGKTFAREASGSVVPKAPADYRVVGRPVPRLDIPPKVFGGQRFVHDLRLEGMVHGRVVRPPAYRARLETVDESAAAALPGVVRVVRDGSFLAVVAEREEQAIAAARRLRDDARWNLPNDLPLPGDLPALIRKMKADVDVIDERGKPAASPAQSLKATYYRPFQAHASIGPSAAVAVLGDGGYTVWTHSQGVFPLQRALAEVLGAEAATIHVIHMEGAGCYGHNGADDAALDAVLMARAVPGRPVRVQWMREDEFAWEPYGSAMTFDLEAGLDGNGRVVSWKHDFWSWPHSTRPSGGGGNLLAAGHLENPLAPAPPFNAGPPRSTAGRNAIPLYAFPARRVVKHFIPESPIRASAHRSLGAYGNVFAIESFMDELAQAAGADPVAFRLAHLEDPRARAVIEAVVARAGWSAGKKRTPGRGRGFAFAQYKNSGAYQAMVADVSVDAASGEVRFERAVAVVDAGLVVNPDGLRNQIEGGIIQSASWTLKEEVTFDHGGITSRDWSGYPILTFEEVPGLDVELLDRPGEPALGAGEVAQGPTAAAIANAIHDATGARLRELPFTPARVAQALNN